MCDFVYYFIKRSPKTAFLVLNRAGFIWGWGLLPLCERIYLTHTYDDKAYSERNIEVAQWFMFVIRLESYSLCVSYVSHTLTVKRRRMHGKIRLVRTLSKRLS